MVSLCSFPPTVMLSLCSYFISAAYVLYFRLGSMNSKRKTLFLVFVFLISIIVHVLAKYFGKLDKNFYPKKLAFSFTA